MKNILLADAGSTKTDWALLRKEKGNSLFFQTPGINPLQHSRSEILQTLESVKEFCNDKRPDAIFFFGAGCLPGTPISSMRDCLDEKFPDVSVHIESDLMAACKALFGDGSGLACILGTGSNTCRYHKGGIEQQIPAMGYILGDEGSGAAMGKRLLNAVFKRLLPEDIIEKFLQEYNISLSGLIENIYKTNRNSSYLASFAPFLLKNSDNPSVDSLINSEIDNFFRHNVVPYRLKSRINAGFVGSIAVAFQPYIERLAPKYDLNILKVMKTPMSGLETYFREKYL